MKTFTPVQERGLLALAVFGLIVPNGIFIYLTVTQPELVDTALANPISLVFIIEAFALMFLFAWLIHHRGHRSPGWVAFIIMSLVGSLMFSVPAFLFLASRSQRQSGSS